MEQKKSRILLTVFFVGLVAVTALLTYGIVPNISSRKASAEDEIPRWVCLEILTGDLVRLTHGDETNLVHLAGIAAPPVHRGAALDRMAAALGLTVDETLERGQIARKSLTTWMYRRTVRMIRQPGLPENHPGAVEAYVEISGVDVGKKVLEHGQATVLEVEHDKRGVYERAEARARERKLGLWRE